MVATGSHRSTTGFKLAEIAAEIGGRVSGDGQKLIRGAEPFETAQEDDITLAGGAPFLKRLDQAAAGAIIVPSGFDCAGRNIVQAENPPLAFAKALTLFHRPVRPAAGISPTAFIGAHVDIGQEAFVGPFVYVGDHVRIGERAILHAGVFLGEHTRLGDDVEIFPNVTVLHGSRIGNRVSIHAGTVIGSDGFGYAPDGRGYFKIPHRGFVQIEDDVEIGACNTIDRAKFGKTHIGRGVKTDNLVHIAHNVTVGEDTVIVAQVGISGSVTVGRHVVMAGQTGVAGHLTIGDDVTLGPRAGVLKDIPRGQVMSGTPTMPHRLWLKMLRILPQLPEMQKKLAAVEKRLQALRNER